LAPTLYADIKTLVGGYTLTIELDPACAGFPGDAYHRTYQANLDDIGFHYLEISVTGGGFREKTVMGELFSGQLRLKWNEFDGETIHESLDANHSLEISADGPVSTSSSALTALAEGYAYLFTNGVVSVQCRGRHRFSFERGD